LAQGFRSHFASNRFASSSWRPTVCTELFRLCSAMLNITLLRFGFLAMCVSATPCTSSASSNCSAREDEVSLMQLSTQLALKDASAREDAAVRSPHAEEVAKKCITQASTKCKEANTPDKCADFEKKSDILKVASDPNIEANNDMLRLSADELCGTKMEYKKESLESKACYTFFEEFQNCLSTHDELCPMIVAKRKLFNPDPEKRKEGAKDWFKDANLAKGDGTTGVAVFYTGFDWTKDCTDPLIKGKNQYNLAQDIAKKFGTQTYPETKLGTDMNEMNANRKAVHEDRVSFRITDSNGNTTKVVKEEKGKLVLVDGKDGAKKFALNGLSTLFLLPSAVPAGAASEFTTSTIQGKVHLQQHGKMVQLVDGKLKPQGTKADKGDLEVEFHGRSPCSDSDFGDASHAIAIAAGDANVHTIFLLYVACGSAKVPIGEKVFCVDELPALDESARFQGSAGPRNDKEKRRASIAMDRHFIPVATEDEYKAIMGAKDKDVDDATKQFTQAKGKVQTFPELLGACSAAVKEFEFEKRYVIEGHA